MVRLDRVSEYPDSKYDGLIRELIGQGHDFKYIRGTLHVKGCYATEYQLRKYIREELGIKLRKRALI